MKKVFTLLMTSFLMFPGLMLKSQVITTISEDFEDGLISERWQPEKGDTVFTLTNVDDGGNRVLQIDVDKNSGNTTGFTAIRYTMEEGFLLDLADNPYLSVKVKTDTDVPLQINLMADGYNWGVTAITYNIAGNGEWVDLIYDFSSVLVDTIDASAVKSLLINFNPGWQLWYAGTVWFDDFKVGEAAAPAPGTFFVDYFNYETVNTEIYKADENGSHVFTMDENTLKIDVNKVAIWDGFVVQFPEALDLSTNPLTSVKIKTTKNIAFTIYVWDVNGYYVRSDITFDISASNDFNTYYFDWTNRFWHALVWNDPPDAWVPIDSTQITSLLININGGTAGDFGTVWMEDLRVGSIAEIQTLSNDKDVLSTLVGVLSGNAIKNVPEGTTAGDLLDGLTISDKASAVILKSSGGSQAAGSDVLTNDFVVEVTAENGTKKEYTIELLVIPADALRILKLPGTVDNPTFIDTEDGEIDPIWANYTAINMENILTDAEATHDGPSDLSGTFKTVWNEYALYILAEITDDVLINNSANTYADDAVEVFLDMTNKKNDVNTGYGSDDYQILFGYNETEAEVFIGGGTSGHVFGWEQGLADGGYWIEIEFDMEALLEPTGMTAEIGHVLGMDLQVDDDDGNIVVEGDGTAREQQMMWNAELNENWHDPSGFGIAVLAGSSLDVKKVNEAIVHSRVYPNPSKEGITISNTQDVELIEVYSITGQNIITIANVDFTSETTLDMSTISTGMYIIKLVASDGTIGTIKFMKE